MRIPLSARSLGVIAGAVALVAASVVTAGAVEGTGRADHPRRVPPVGLATPRHVDRSAAAANGQAASPQEFSTTANPTSLDPPLTVPPTRPVVVTIADDAAFGNGPPPATSTVTLPRGRFSEVVLDITGTETGVQYDRLCEIFAGASEIFLGVTPEPTPQGITWHVQKDVTGYLPLFQGTQTFSTYVDNYLSSVDTGIPTITAKLLFYPAGGGFRPAQVAGPSSPALAGNAIDETGPASSVEKPGVPSSVVPLLPSGATNTLNTINSGQTLSATVTLPSNVDTATLDLYAVGQINDEFWWGELPPAFREIEVSIDGTPAGVVWPFPYVYTGGVNPLIWRPLTGIHTLDIPSYRLDLTPFAGLLAGTHTITLTVVNNAGYWLAGGSLLLTTGHGSTTGHLLSDTLSFPTTSTVTTTDALGSSDNLVTTESAAKSYEISGEVSEGHRSFTDTIRQSLQFEDDESNIDPSCSGPCYEWVHAEETQSTSEDSTAGGGVWRSDKANWTIDAPNGFLTDSSGDFFLPADVNQEQTDFASQHGGYAGQLTSSLLESIIGYGALEEDSNGNVPVTDGDTTGIVTYRTSGGGPSRLYERSIVTSGGQIVQSLGGDQLPSSGDGGQGHR